MNKYDLQYYQIYNDTQSQIDAIFSGLVFDLSKLCVAVDYGEEFLFKQHLTISKKADLLIEQARRKINVLIVDTTKTVWDLSNTKNDALVASKFATPPKAFTLRNQDALDAFATRKTAGFTVSDRVWRNSETLKSELETAIDAALAKGQSAAQLSKEIRGYLVNPDKKFRRIRDKYGKLKPSTIAQEFHPGQGVYRSSYKNAMRLATNEINVAYRKADSLRWQQSNFVIGYKVVTSPRSATVCPLCQRLAGIYPKTLVFLGNHISCRCTAIPILCTDEQFDEIQQAILNGTEIPTFGLPPIPKEFLSYISEVKDKVLAMSPAKYPSWFAENKSLLKR